MLDGLATEALLGMNLVWRAQTSFNLARLLGEMTYELYNKCYRARNVYNSHYSYPSPLGGILYRKYLIVSIHLISTPIVFSKSLKRG